QPPVLQLRDANGNAVSQTGVTVTAVIATGPTGATLTNAAATTTGSGAATFNGLAISGPVGNYTLRFGSGSLSAPTSGTIALSAGAAATIAANSATSQSATAGTAVSAPPSVIVKDANGNPVTGVAVTFAVTPGNGSITGESQTTNTSGVATVGTWTLSGTAGSNTLTATSGSLSGSPVTFTATGTAGAPTQLSITTQPSSSAQSGAAFTPQPVVQLQDANGNAVSEAGTGVTAVVATGPAGAALANATATTGGTGAAAFSGLAISGPVGSYTLRFESGTLTAVTSGTIALSAASTTTTIADHTPDPSVVGQGIAVTYSVTAAGGAPSGDVTVNDGTESCTGTVATGGCTLTPTAAGGKTLTATYAGTADFAGSTSTGVPHTVNPAATTTTMVTEAPDPSTVGDAVTFTFNVATNAPGAGTPTGTVTVSDGTQNC